VKVPSLTLSYIPWSMKYDSQVSLLAHNLANPYLGHESKARVETIFMQVELIMTTFFKV
jgi:hypothetical protein